MNYDASNILYVTPKCFFSVLKTQPSCTYNRRNPHSTDSAACSTLNVCISCIYFQTDSFSSYISIQNSF